MALDQAFWQDYINKLGTVESGWKNVQNAGGGSASGYFQFIPSTGQQYGLPTPASSAPLQQQTDAAIALGQDNATRLTNAGLDVTPGNLYILHQQGPGGIALLQNPDTPAGQLVPAKNISNNGGDPNAPASQFTSMWDKKFNGGKGSAPSGLNTSGSGSGCPPGSKAAPAGTPGSTGSGTGASGAGSGYTLDATGPSGGKLFGNQADLNQDYGQDFPTSSQPVVPGQTDPHKSGFDPSAVPFINTPVGGS